MAGQRTLTPLMEVRPLLPESKERECVLTFLFCFEGLMGYHKRKIKKGVYGEVSKIREELEELEDSEEQGVRIMSLCELSDLYGAIRAVAQKYNVTMDDLEKMADRTEEAFRDGTRS